MLPVSGAEQLKTSDANTQRPICSARKAYSWCACMPAAACQRVQFCCTRKAATALQARLDMAGPARARLIMRMVLLPIAVSSRAQHDERARGAAQAL